MRVTVSDTGAPESDNRIGLRWWDLVPVTVLVLFVGTRDGVGTDTPTYILLFENLNATSLGAAIEQSELELLYVALTYLVKSLGGGSGTALLLAAVLAVVPTYIAIRRLCANPELALGYYILLGFYGLSFNVVRQAIAMGLILLAYSFIRTKPVVALTLLAASVGFHLTAAVPVAVLIILVLLPRSVRPVAVLTALVAAAIMLRGGEPISLLEDNEYGKYLTVSEGLGRYLLLIAFVLLIAYALVVTKRLSIEIAMPIIGLIFLVVGLEYVAVGRLGQYFLLFLVIAIGNAREFKLSRAGGTVVAAAAAIFFVVQTMTLAGLVPYQSWLL
ncbi:EpsG family protein [Dietzia maris]|uniref:EpsG family protein n=1 Tax=Dietzia maris TaxID=37915 RepID=UPI00223BF764|nr:EpsG family protein [Dietzia maris]MCT1435502.1 EpsG family protein [Dietzia maris]